MSGRTHCKHGHEIAVVGRTKSGYCRECLRQGQRQWRERNREQERERKRQWRGRNREQERERQRQWREQNRERSRELQRDYRERNPERCHELQRDYRERNPERTKERQRQWYERTRLAAIKALGGRCARCGAKEPLDLHHPNREGVEHRASFDGKGGISAYYRSIAAGDLRGYAVELLCERCHAAEHSAERAARMAETMRRASRGEKS